MSKDIEKKHHQTFEELKQTNEAGMEFWSSRQLAKFLDYAELRNFQTVIEKAKKACENSGQQVENHFVDMHEMVEIGSGAKRHQTFDAGTEKVGEKVKGNEVTIFEV